MIKKLFSVCVLALLPMAAGAQEVNCMAVYTYAGSVMEDVQNRDKYFTKEWHIQAIEREVDAPKEVKGFIVEIVEVAYDVPRFYRKQQREESVPAFAEYSYRECVKRFGD